jgi:hypothetical protein
MPTASPWTVEHMGAAEDGDELNAIPFFETLHHFSAPAEDLPADISPAHPHRLRLRQHHGPDTGSQCAYRRATCRIKAYLVA